MPTLSGAPDADQPSSSFAALAAAIHRRQLTDAQAAALLAILQEVELWSVLAERAPLDRPEHMSDPFARNAYLVGLSDRALETYRVQLALLADSPPT
jgi:hypothetical protein